MSTEFFNDQWRIPSNENQNKVSNYSMDFNGSSSYIDAGSASYLNGLSQFSISVWFNLHTAADAKCIISDWNYNTSPFGHFALRTVDTSGTNYALRIYIKKDLSDAGSNAVTTPVIFTENTWYNAVFTYNSGTITCYINGSSVSSTITGTIASNLLNQDGILTIGNWPGLSQYWDGQIDQVTVFDYELSPIQVASLGLDGYAFNFIPNDYINAGTGLGNSLGTYTGDASVSLWFKADTTISNDGLFSMTPFDGNTFGNLRINISSNILYFVSSELTSWKTIPFTDTTSWHHLVCIFKSGDITNSKIYLDGIDQTTTDVGTFPSSLSMTGKKTIIGGYYGTNNTFDGELSNVSFFNTGLSQPQVNTLYNNGKPLTDMSSFTSLQGWWKLDDTATFNSGTSVWSIPDDSSNSNTGTSVGMTSSSLVASNINGELIANPMITSPKPIAYYQVPNNSLSDYVFDFDGNNQYLQVPDSNDLSFGNGSTDSPFSISAWVNMDSNASFRIVNKYDAPNYEYQFDTSASGELRFFVLDGTGYRGRTGSTLNTSQWYHVVATYSGVGGTNAQNGTKIYVNGANVVGSTSTFGSYTAMSNTTAPVYIGRIATSYSNGRISNAAIFNTELSSTQVQTIYNNGAPNDISSLSPVAWWKLNAEDVFAYPNWVIRDSAGSNNGASVGMTSANLVQSNLQLGVGFSPYAFELDGTSQYFNCGTELANSLGNGVTNFSFSGWYTAQGGASNEGLFGIGNGTTNIISLTQNNYAQRTVTIGSLQYSRFIYDSRNQWANFVVVVSGDGNSPLTIKYYHDGVEIISPDSPNYPNSLDFSGNNAYIGNHTDLLKFFKGEISNFSFFNFALTSAQVIELNNNQRTSNLNNLSFAKPLAWWQLGSNSSFNSGTWTALNEGTVAGGNAVSIANMSENDIVNGVGYSGNGLGTSSIDIKGDAPYSSANGLSESMDVLDRTLDTPIRNTHSIQLDGIDDYIDFGDSDDLSFGNGAAM
jgi:hypothetical protein